jgi:hypothetical protein
MKRQCYTFHLKNSKNFAVLDKTSVCMIAFAIYHDEQKQYNRMKTLFAIQSDLIEGFNIVTDNTSGLKLHTLNQDELKNTIRYLKDHNIIG